MKLVNGTVTYNFKDESGKEQSVTSPVSYQECETSEDIISLLQTPESLKVALNSLNYATNLNARSAVRQKLIAQADGPGKAIDKAIRDLVKAREAMGRPISEDAARALIVG